MNNPFIWLHQRLIHPWLKHWALKAPQYSLLALEPDRWTLPRWVHHFVVKAGLQGIWPIFVTMIFGVPLWLGLLFSVGIMWGFKNWNSHPRNVLDYICDTLLQVLIPVMWWNPWTITVISPIYFSVYPYSTP